LARFVLVLVFVPVFVLVLVLVIVIEPIIYTPRRRVYRSADSPFQSRFVGDQ